LLDLERISLNLIGSFATCDSVGGFNGKTSFWIAYATSDSASSTKNSSLLTFFIAPCFKQKKQIYEEYYPSSDRTSACVQCCLPCR